MSIERHCRLNAEKHQKLVNVMEFLSLGVN